MPDHVKNRIEISGSPSQVDELIERFGTKVEAHLSTAHDASIICKTKDDKVGWFDLKTGVFARRGQDDVMGIPEGYEMEINSAFIHFPDFRKIVPHPENIFLDSLGAKEREMCKREGRPNWYNWQIANWGTKWNSYSCEREGYNVFWFETAWSGVPALIEKMSLEFPDIEIAYEYSSEDTGYNCGVLKLKNGIQDKYVPDGGSKEAYDIAFRLRPSCREWYELVNGAYECKDD